MVFSIMADENRFATEILHWSGITSEPNQSHSIATDVSPNMDIQKVSHNQAHG